MEKEFPLVTIVTPSYNQAAYLRATIESVLTQTYPRIEYIIMDGGSTDGSVEIIRAYENRLAYWQSERDKGQSDAINKGWQRAHGEIIAFLNSDDTYNPGAVSASVDALLENPNAAFSYGDCAWIDARGKEMGVMRAAPFTLRDLLLQNRVAQPTVFARRAHVERAGWLDSEMHWLMDYDLWLVLMLHHPAVQVHGVLANFRLHDMSKTSALSQGHLRDRQKILEKMFNAPAFPPELEPLQERALTYAYFEIAAQCYSLGLMDAGNVIMQECFEKLKHPLSQRHDIVSLFANHLVHFAPLRLGDGKEMSAVQEKMWLDELMQNLPPRAADLRQLEAEILAQAQVIHAFESRGRGAWGETRGHLVKAVRLNPALLRQRGIASLLAQGVAHSVRRTGRNALES